MSRAKQFEAKAEALRRLGQEVPVYRQIYEELAKVWYRLARQAERMERPA